MAMIVTIRIRLPSATFRLQAAMVRCCGGRHQAPDVGRLAGYSCLYRRRASGISSLASHESRAPAGIYSRSPINQRMAFSLILDSVSGGNTRSTVSAAAAGGSGRWLRGGGFSGAPGTWQASQSPGLPLPGSGEVYLGREWGRWPLRAWGESQEDNGVRSIYFAGGGIYFFWQLGVAKYLGQRFDLSRTPMSGTSCGALCATLAACGVDPERALQTAYQLSLEADLWDRPLGLAGIWGRLILEWMEELLPEEAAEMCRDRVEIMVTELPSLQQTPVADFKNKDDLIAVNMASIHVPIFLDWRFTRECRGKQCVDGSLPDVVFRRASPTGSGSVDNEDTNQIVISHVMDDSLRLEEFGFLKLREYEEVVHMMDLGYRFAQDLEASGAFIGLPAMSSSAE
mmetsp:Transcript_38568/g.109070  ORF Transcript_38568/g.109070 Transcript_38568/m.109070 type:complete len:398 (+) Transcript_38568:42-1235(+)